MTAGGSDDSWVDRDETVTEDVGLPEHERDETRRQAGETGLDDAAGLPEHEDDSRGGTDTASGEQNP